MGHLPMIRYGVLAFAIFLASCAGTVKHVPIDRLVVFGDSNVDNGNRFRMYGSPAPPNWRGRNSNGPNVADYLAKGLGVKSQNYAVSGATFSGVRLQIDQFIQKDGGRLSASDLVVLWAGSNDIVGIGRSDGAAPPEAIAQVSANLTMEIDRLYGLGARRMLVGNLSARAELASENNLNRVDLNKAIAAAVSDAAKRTGANIQLFDAYGAIADMMNHPDRYGFVEVRASCRDAPACVAEKYDDGLKIANEYVQWDILGHKTTRVHSLMAEKILGMVKP
jgi:phospholipase/lecithinase/hemolysin